MTTVREHYSSHLAPVYLWMAGGASVALSAGETDIRDLRGPPGLAVDLGAGFGMHSIPLARAGAQGPTNCSSPFATTGAAWPLPRDFARRRAGGHLPLEADRPGAVHAVLQDRASST